MDDNQKQKQTPTNIYNTYRNAKAAQQALRLTTKLATRIAIRAAAALAGSPAGWAIAIGIGIVVLFTFIIVFSTGGSNFIHSETQSAPITEPTIPSVTPSHITPTPQPEPT